MNHIEAGKLIGFAQVGERPQGDFYATPAIAVDKLLALFTPYGMATVAK